jgi:type II secretory pathway pseudopilin PulG
MNKALILLSALTAAALPGWAALGGSVDTVATDQVKFQAKRAITQMRTYNIHLISSNDGTVIKEYVTPAGKVFGVSWTGPTIPDLTQLLGTYSAEFQTTVRAQPGRRKAGVVHNPDLVVESTGHMRAFYGRAYVNSLLPSAVTAEMVQ